MGIFDRIQINDPRIPQGCGAWFQCYVDIADSYGDFYEISPNGYLYRLTVQACMSRNPKYAFAAPLFVDDYNDTALVVHEDGLDGNAAYYLAFRRGRLFRFWRHPDFYPYPERNRPKLPRPSRPRPWHNELFEAFLLRRYGWQVYL